MAHTLIAAPAATQTTAATSRNAGFDALRASMTLLVVLHHTAITYGAQGALTRRAYTIYIIHPPILVAVALAWRSVPANPLLKFAITGSISCVLCFVLAGGLLRVRALRAIL